MFEPYIEEWRELGCYCDHDTNNRQYRLVGSRSGLSKFAELLEWMTIPSMDHCHSWPNWPSSSKAHLAAAAPGERVTIREEFAPDAEFALILDVREEGFDPPSAEEELDGGAGSGRD